MFVEEAIHLEVVVVETVVHEVLQHLQRHEQQNAMAQQHPQRRQSAIEMKC